MTFPSEIKFESVTVKTKFNNFVTKSRSFKTIARATPAHQYEVRLRTTNLDDDKLRVMNSFIDSLDGRYGAFDVILPIYSTPRGVATGTPVLNGSKSIGDTSIAVSGYSGSVTGIAKDGDYIRFGNHTKVYQVKDDANTNGSGQTTLTINPGLLVAVTSGTAITVTDVPFNIRLTGDVQEFSASTKRRYPSIEITGEETLL